MTELLVGLVMVAGLAGIILPFLPGLPLIWGAALAYGLVEGFGTPGIAAMIAITVFFVAGVAAKIIVPQRRASAGGAPLSTLLAGAVLGVIGFFVIPFIGLPLGAALGVLLAEYRRTRDWPNARRSTKDVIVGFGIGALLEMAAAIVMVGSWVIWVLATT